MSNQKRDVNHCMAVTGELKLPHDDMLIDACQQLKHCWHQKVTQFQSKIAGKHHYSM